MTDANAGFTSSLTHVKEVKQFLMEIIEELGKKEHVRVRKQNGFQISRFFFLSLKFRFLSVKFIFLQMREIRKICRDYHITQMAAEVCVTYIKHYG